MKRIQALVDQIKEEIEGAKDYAEMSLDFKSKGDNGLAVKFRDMSNDELRHAMVMHDYALDEIKKLETVFTAPVEMQEKWNLAHREYVEQVAWVKTMLQM